MNGLEYILKNTALNIIEFFCFVIAGGVLFIIILALIAGYIMWKDSR